MPQIYPISWLILYVTVIVLVLVIVVLVSFFIFEGVFGKSERSVIEESWNW